MIPASGRARRRHRLLGLVGASVAILIQAQGVAAAGGWTLTAAPQTIVAGSSSSVRLTIQNISSPDTNDIGCVKVTIPSIFTVGSPSVVSVSSGRDWSAHRSGHTVTATGDSNGDRLRGDPFDDTLVLDVPAGASLIAVGTWTVRVYDQNDCEDEAFQSKSIVITVIASSPTSTPDPTPKPTPRPTPRPSPTAAPTPTRTDLPTATPTRPAGPTSAPTARPTAAASPLGSLRADPSVSPVPSSTDKPAVPTSTPGIGLVGPVGPVGPRPNGDQFDGVITIPVDEADPSFPRLGLDVLATLGLFAWAVPGALLAAPGLLLIVVILAQAMGAMAWLPVVRRRIGAFGPGRSTRPRA